MLRTSVRENVLIESPQTESTWPRVAAIAAALVVGTYGIASIGGCSFIRFERGPYIVRDLQVVYSRQEKTTFLSWKLRRDAKVSLVDFELYRDGSYRRIDLAEAPFPAEPWKCDGNRTCFQYQIPGRYRVPEDRSPVRSRHEQEGIYAGPNAEVREVQTTFDIDPIGLGRNRRIDPERIDWFDEHDVPLRRDWQWQFVPHSEGSCGSTGGGWRRMEGTVSVDYSWVERSVCFATRPVRRDRPGDEVKRRLVPSAETRFTRQTYEPGKNEAPIVYGILFDAVIASNSRCEAVKQKLLPAIQKAVEKRGDHRSLGVFTPISRKTGNSLSGCNQEARRYYPVGTMIREARELKEKLEPTRVKILWVYVNNVPVRPEEAILDQLADLTTRLPGENDLPVYNWGIGSNPILQAIPWDHRIGWRPIEDDTFLGDIRAFAENHLPFATMDHSSDEQIPVEKPKKADDPKAFKICQSTPVPVDAVGLDSGGTLYHRTDASAPWPETGRPFFRLSLSPQILVPKQEYRKVRVDLVVEVCERFCGNPFRTRGGEDFESWNDTPGNLPMEVCQWRQ